MKLSFTLFDLERTQRHSLVVACPIHRSVRWLLFTYPFDVTARFLCVFFCKLMSESSNNLCLQTKFFRRKILLQPREHKYYAIFDLCSKCYPATSYERGLFHTHNKKLPSMYIFLGGGGGDLRFPIFSMLLLGKKVNIPTQCWHTLINKGWERRHKNGY